MLPRKEDIATVIAIVSYRAARLTIDCLAALEPEVAGSPGTSVIVVDNASADTTAQEIDQAIRTRGWSSWVHLVIAPTNGGFASGNNIAVRLARSLYPRHRFVMLLNPDTMICAGSLQAIADFMNDNPAAGIAGGQCIRPDGNRSFSAFRFPGPWGEFLAQIRLQVLERLLGKYVIPMAFSEVPCEADWVVGAIMMIRREVFEAIGLMDEGYFLYYEETDFSLRARRAGWKTWHVPAFRVIHLEGQITGIEDGPRDTRLPQYWFESRRRYFVLNHGVPYAACVDVATISGAILFSTGSLIRSRVSMNPPHFVSDLLRHGALTQGASGLPARVVQ